MEKQVKKGFGNKKGNTNIMVIGDEEDSDKEVSTNFDDKKF